MAELLPVYGCVVEAALAAHGLLEERVYHGEHDDAVWGSVAPAVAVCVRDILKDSKQQDQKATHECEQALSDGGEQKQQENWEEKGNLQVFVGPRKAVDQTIA